MFGLASSASGMEYSGGIGGGGLMDSSSLFFGSADCRDLIFRGARSAVAAQEGGVKRQIFFSDDFLELNFSDEQITEKKRRLSPEQVKELERSFEAESWKLEPERKMELATKLGLQPRQVAVWFQNRRARWKTKQLEHDFSLLKLSYDSILAQNDALLADNRLLRIQVEELTEKLDLERELAALSAKGEHPVVAERVDGGIIAVVEDDDDGGEAHVRRRLDRSPVNSFFHDQDSFLSRRGGGVMSSSDEGSDIDGCNYGFLAHVHLSGGGGGFSPSPEDEDSAPLGGWCVWN